MSIISIGRRALATAASCTLAACSQSVERPPDPVTPLPAADPGYVLTVPAPPYGRTTGWDLAAGRLIVGDATLWSIDLATRVATALPSPPVAVSPPISYLNVSPTTGAIFLTAGQLDGTNILSRLDRGAAQSAELSQLTGQSFALSPKGRWLIYSKNGTTEMTRLDTQTGDRLALINSGFVNVVDDSGRQLLTLSCNANVTICTYGVLDVLSGATRMITPPADYVFSALSLPQATFVGDNLLLLLREFVGSNVGLTEWDEATRTARSLGRVPSGPFDLGCLAWSPASHSAIVMSAIAGYDSNDKRRFAIWSLGNGTPTLIGSADLFAPLGCSLSPDGKWFAYGNATGYVIGGGRTMYLKPVP